MPELNNSITPTRSTTLSSPDPGGKFTAAELLILATKADVDLSNVEDLTPNDMPVSAATATSIGNIQLTANQRDLRYKNPLFIPVSPMSKGLPLPIDEPIVISNTSGTQDYNSWPSVNYWEKTDELIVVWRRGDSHAGTLTGEIMMSRSLDGTVGRAWSTPAIIIANDGGDYRDPMVYCLDDRVMVFTSHFDSYGTDEDGRGEVWESFDRTTFTKVGEVISTGDVEGTFADYNRAIVNGELIIGPNGELIIGGFEANTRQNSSQVFHRSVCWASTDYGRTWLKKSTVMPPVFSDSADRSSATVKPNETCLLVHEGALLAFVRNSGGNGAPQQLLRVRSTDFGTTWGTPVDVTFPRWNQMIPAVQLLPDGRIFLPHRSGGNNPVSFSVSYDGGLTWPETTVSDLEWSEYEKLVVVDNQRAVSIFGRDTDVNKTESIIYAASKDISQTRRPNDPAPFLFDAAFDSRDLNYLRSTTTDRLGPAWIQGDITRRPTLESDSDYRSGNFARFSAATGVVYTGGANDYEYLHDGSPFTVGVCYNVEAPTKLTPLLATCEPSSIRTGFSLMAGSGHRLSVNIYKGTSGFPALEWESANNLTEYQKWQVVVVSFDGTDYTVYLNGNPVDTFAVAPTYGSGAHSSPLSVGKAEDATLITTDELEVSRTFVMTTALDKAGAIAATLWLDK